MGNEFEAFSFAPAKVNLTLHIRGKRPDGYHELSSLVMFADVGDRLWWSASRQEAGEVASGDASPEKSFRQAGITQDTAQALVLAGPFAARLAGDGNHILKMDAACRRLFGASGNGSSGLRQPDGFMSRFRLEKNLPVAAGIGGGSADAAAALRCWLEYWQPRVSLQHYAADVQQIMLQVGADVPVCFYAQSCLMQGLGETVIPLEELPHLFAVLVNPGVGVSTAKYFNA